MPFCEFACYRSRTDIVDPLRETGVFPNLVVQMIGVGEQTGSLDNMLQKIADFYEDEVDVAVGDLLTAMEPSEPPGSWV